MENCTLCNSTMQQVAKSEFFECENNSCALIYHSGNKVSAFYYKKYKVKIEHNNNITKIITGPRSQITLPIVIDLKAHDIDYYLERVNNLAAFN